jgi:hypothetical protein
MEKKEDNFKILWISDCDGKPTAIGAIIETHIIRRLGKDGKERRQL